MHNINVNIIIIINTIIINILLVFEGGFFVIDLFLEFREKIREELGSL